MQATITKNPEKSEAEISITVSVADFTPYVERASKKLAKENPIKGFRPGKISIPLAVEHYGHERVLNTALDRALSHFFVEAVLDNDLEAIGRPTISITELSIEKGLAFNATVAILPEATLGDISKIKVDKREVSVSDEDVEREIKYLAKARSTALEVARPAQKGDTVTVDFKISDQGKLLEGGESQNHPVQLGEGHFIPDFEEKLVGIQVGDVREFSMQFPEDYAQSEYKGKTVEAWVKAHSVQQRILPTIDDEFAKKIGKFTDLAHLKQEIKTNLQEEKKHKEKERYQSELAEALAKQASFGAIPDILIEREIDHRLAEFSQFLSYQGKTVDDYLANKQKTLDQVRDEMRPAAETSVKVGLSLKKLAKQERIVVDEKEVDEQVQAYVTRYASVKEAQRDIDQEELRQSLESTIRNQKTLQRLEELTSAHSA